MERLLHISVALVFAFIVIGLWWEGGLCSYLVVVVVVVVVVV